MTQTTTICSDESYRITFREELRAKDAINDHTVETILMGAEDGLSETYWLLTAEQELLRHFPLFDWSYDQERLALIPIRASLPTAYLFQVRGDAFYQLGGGEGEAQWRTVRGVNRFRATIAGTNVRVVGQTFSIQDLSCRQGTRSMTLLVENLEALSVAEIEQIIEYYNLLFPLPEQLYIAIYGSLEQARSGYRALFPLLDKGPVPRNPDEGDRSVVFSRRPWPKILIYEGDDAVYTSEKRRE